MRLLADEIFLGDAVDSLRKHGNDVGLIRTDYPGVSDEQVLAVAQRERRVVMRKLLRDLSAQPS